MTWVDRYFEERVEGFSFHGLLGGPEGDVIEGVVRVKWLRGAPVEAAVWDRWNKIWSFSDDALRRIVFEGGPGSEPWTFLTAEEAEDVIEVLGG